MRKSTLHAILLLQRLTILMAAYTLCRLLFFFINYKMFAAVPKSELLCIFAHGIRFDLAAVVYFNILFILLHLIPFDIRNGKGYQGMLAFLFFLFNIPALAFNFIDFIYFRFTLKRTTADIFRWTGLGTELKTLIPKFITDFWFVFLFFFLLIILLIWFYNKTLQSLRKNELKTASQNRNVKLQLLYFLLLTGLLTIGVRGGLQLRPISILNASEGIDSQNIALVLNTPFSIVQTLEKEGLKEIKYMSEDRVQALFPMTAQPNNSAPFQKSNVVLIILESFGKEYSGALNGYKGHTPFLDSLMQQSLYFTNAFANGKRSIEGIPSVIAALPALMENPYITSGYSGNQIQSLGLLLKAQGYQTAFFHGGTNGTMGFDNFTRMAGFDKYYGRNEYHNDKDYDGTWGIFDGPFLQYVATTLNSMPQPFVSCCFTLSSHHPYTLPAKYASKFPKGSLEIHQSIEYADYALKDFFKTAAKMPWYRNTLFVLTADHASLSEFPQYQTALGSYRIPLILYQTGSKLKGRNMEVVQQIDILPSVLDYIHYPKSYTSFGTSVFSQSGRHCAINFMNNIYQYIEKDYLLQFDGTLSRGLYKFDTDSLLKNNLIFESTSCKDSMELHAKAIIQSFNNRMFQNKLSTQH